MRPGFSDKIVFAALAFAVLVGTPMSAIAQAPPGAGPKGGPPGPGGPGDPLGPDLFIAIRGNQPEQVGALLDKGAQTEARNWLGITPLLWASARGNQKVIEVLLQHKADVNGDSIYGGPLEFAVMGGKPEIVQLLLSHGATFSSKRSDQITALMGAAEKGNAEVLQMLLKRKPDVNAADAAGCTALSHAARRGRLQAAQILIGAGAAVETKDNLGTTPLMFAAQNGYSDVVSLLLAHGASVNAKDKNGSTPLILAARYSGDPAVAALLVKAGADIAARDVRGKTAARIAVGRGFGACARAIDASTHAVPVAGSLADRARAAAITSLSLIQTTTRAFTEHSGCSSCHHQGIGLMATGTAQSLGFKIDQQLASSEQKVVVSEGETNIADLRKLLPHPEMYKHFVAVDMNELSPSLGTTLCGISAHKAPRTEVTDAFATLLARQQMEDGSWGYGFERQPIQSSPFAFTAYAIRSLKTYAPDGLTVETKDRIQKSLAWLMATPARNNEDRAFRLLGLKWAGAPKSEVDKAIAEIRRTQRTDGGWAQFTGPTEEGAGFMRTDAYATGESLYALHVGGEVPTSDAAYTRGVKYLLNTQDEDGSWFVNKRAVAANNYFDTGFPHGESQFVSYGATCWAAMALMFAATGGSAG